MAATLQYLIDNVRRRSNMENSQFISDEELTDYINESYKELYDLLITTVEDYNINIEYFTLTLSDNGAFELPEDFYKLRGVDLNSNTENKWQLVRSFSMMDRNRYSYGVYSRLAYYAIVQYRIQGNNLTFIPVDQAVGNFRMFYAPLIIPLASSSDEILQCMQPWQDYIICDCCIKCLAKEESSVYPFDQQKIALTKRIEGLAVNRDDGEPKRVQNTRYRYWNGNGFYPEED